MPIYLKYGDIKGEATEPAHRGYIELTRLQWGVGRGVSTPTGTSAQRERAAPSVSEIVVTKVTDRASQRLFSEANGGMPVPAVVDFVQGDGGSVYLRLEMSGTMISSYSFSGKGDNPTESLRLNFTKIEFKNTPGTPPP